MFLSLLIVLSSASCVLALEGSVCGQFGETVPADATDVRECGAACAGPAVECAHPAYQQFETTPSQEVRLRTWPLLVSIFNLPKTFFFLPFFFLLIFDGNRRRRKCAGVRRRPTCRTSRQALALSTATLRYACL